MSSKKPDKTSTAKKNRAAEIANTFEWLITAFILAFVFRTFVMEAFRIPTGSMAETLMGSHYRLRCPQCGYKYNYGLGNFPIPPDTIPRGYLRPMDSRCPSCGYAQPTGGAMPLAKGDRILVLKCIYQFFEPKQWDVIVFKNPTEPNVNYIKRLVGRPGETIEIIDGDIYINGLISRKPPKVQNELWMPVYDNDYQPARPQERLFNGHRWRQPFDIEGSGWSIDQKNPTIFTLNSPANQIHALSYNTRYGNDFKASYAYDDIRNHQIRPYCSDLMVRFYANSDTTDGNIGIALSKYENNYKAYVDFSGKMKITKTSGDSEETLTTKSIKALSVNRPTLIKFANVDHQLIFQVGSEKLSYDMGRKPNDAGKINSDIQSEAKIFGSGKLNLSHVAIFRDIHYLSRQNSNSRSGKAADGNPFKLNNDEFFVLGDNTPNSQDSRYWNKPGIGNNGRTFPEGIVPREYMVGKALLVYWPSGFSIPWPDNIKNSMLKNSRKNKLSRIIYVLATLNWIPNVGQVRLIYGGSQKKLTDS